MQIKLDLGKLGANLHKGLIKGIFVAIFYILLAVSIILTVKLADEVLPDHKEYVEEMELVEAEAELPVVEEL